MSLAALSARAHTPARTGFICELIYYANYFSECSPRETRGETGASRRGAPCFEHAYTSFSFARSVSTVAVLSLPLPPLRPLGPSLLRTRFLASSFLPLFPLFFFSRFASCPPREFPRKKRTRTSAGTIDRPDRDCRACECLSAFFRRISAHNRLARYHGQQLTATDRRFTEIIVITADRVSGASNLQYL